MPQWNGAVFQQLEEEQSSFKILSPAESCSLLIPNCSFPPTPKQFLESEPPRPQTVNLFCLFVFSIFSQYYLIQESQSQSPFFPSLHLPHSGHHNSCLFSLPNIDQAAWFSTLPVQAASRENQNLLPELGKETLPRSLHLSTPSFKTVFPCLHFQYLPI